MDRASVRSGSPCSQTTDSSDWVLPASTWCEGVREDLVSNLNPRERTRQELLWEIVASEERYVLELEKLKDSFIDPLLHPHFASSPLSPLGLPGAQQTEHGDYIVMPRFHPTQARVDSPRDSIDHIPIVSRCISSRWSGTSGQRDDTDGRALRNSNSHRTLAKVDGESLGSDVEDESADRMGKPYSYIVGRIRSAASTPSGVGSGAGAQIGKLNHPRSSHGTTATRSSTSTRGSRDASPFPLRSHHSLPPPACAYDLRGSTQSLGRRSFVDEPASPPPPPLERNISASTTNTSASKVFRKFKRSNARGLPEVADLPPGQLPEDLRKCLEVIEAAIYDGHEILSKSLRARYEDQYPLVRSLADVFDAHLHVLHRYATYVLHLERALEQVDDALFTAAASKKSHKQNTDEWLRMCGLLQELELTAAAKGETGLAISLSKPFQRLFDYPHLFQNLLFHTDPSTFEYERTLQMVAEVEAIVRSIEDEKVQKEEQDKTHDVWARIEGVEKVKELALPKPSRLLVEERQILGTGAAPTFSSWPVSNGKIKGKKSFKNVLQGGGFSPVRGNKDVWLVVFNDVVLRCQRTGTTSLPITATVNPRTNSVAELRGKTKYATTGRRRLQAKPRNLYSFLNIETWSIEDVVQPQGVVAMEDFARFSNSVLHTPRDPFLRTLAMNGMGERSPYEYALDIHDADDDETIGITSEESWTLEKHFPPHRGVAYVVETQPSSEDKVINNSSEADTPKMTLTISRRDALCLIDHVQNELATSVAVNGKDLVLRKTLIKLLVRLTHKFNWIPSSLLVHDVNDVSPEPVYAGGFADIFKATHRGKEVALKRFREFLPGHDSTALDKRFHREIFVWKALSHQHVLPFLGVDKDTFPTRLCMVSPWMQNSNLLSYIGTKRCSSRKINELLFHATRGLEYLHSQSVVHGDLRCVNILVNDRDEAVLADFGLASLSAGMANTISIADGSARWNAPELLIGDRVVRSLESDVYSFGCVCLEAYTGQAPFAEVANGFAVVTRVVAGDRPSRPFRPSPHGNLISDGLWTLITMCWDSCPRARPSAQELSSRLGQICSHGCSRSVTTF